MDELYMFLKQQGYEVYFVGQKTTECKTNYIVLKDDGTNAQLGTTVVGSQQVDIILYTPRNQFTALIQFKKVIKNILKSYSKLKYAGLETPTITDDSVNGLTCSIIYLIQKPLI